MIPFELGKDTTIWIIGASSGIGRGLARKLSENVKEVFVSARSKEPLLDLAGKASNITPLVADLADRTSLERQLDRIEKQCGLPDLVIINAAVYQSLPTQAITPELVQQHLEVNLLGPAQLAALLLPKMLSDPSRERALVFVASVAGYRGLPNAGFYGATKAGLISYAESLRGELQGSAVRIQVINPGFVDTPMTRENTFPMPFLMTVDEAVARIIKGLKGQAFEITFPRRLSWTLKCLRLLPYSLFFRITRKLRPGEKAE
ncbi:SDR family NAD(P)-dependent oxidoreductase [Kiloniella sp. b19]|uniref:SDR family NAD(P)-dependent oxidoreductase n=1 Tax=Kiloniella sp. GXU_MW_B19 TaxID=3141326 RepID=UPI0031D127CE